MGIDAKTGEQKKRTKEIYFGARMSEFNNLTRVLQNKKDEGIWNERYSEASHVDECLRDLKTRESGLHELIIEREEALKQHDFNSAQRLKDRFDKNMSDALHQRSFRKFLSNEELRRLRIQDE